MIQTALAGFLSLFGAAFLLVAALGLIRMEDLYTRLHAASKAAPFGSTFLLLSVAVASGELDMIIRVFVIALFLLMTAPIAGHVIGRAAYLAGQRMAPSAPDELTGEYDLENLRLNSSAPRAQPPAPGDRADEGPDQDR